MSRIAVGVNDALLEKRGHGRFEHQPQLNPVAGGQMGWNPNLTQWVSKQAYVKRNLVPILLRAPKFFDLMPEPTVWKQSLKNVIELHPESIEGLAAGLTVETDEHVVGGGGEMFEEVVDVKRARSVPVFNYTDTYGMGISSMFQQWIDYGLMHHETKTALIGTLSNYPKDMLADMYTMTVLFIEPDPTHRKVVNAWLSTNMFPKSNGELTGKRDLANPMEIQKLSIEFTALSQFNVGVKVFAQKVLDGINITSANPWVQPSFLQDIDPTITKAEGGYSKGVQNVADTALERR